MTVDSLAPEDLEYLQTRLVEHMEAAGCMPLDVAHRETVGQLGDAAVGLFQWWQARVDN